MTIEAEGLVILEKYVGESDRLITVLTKQKGVLRAFARRADRMKNGKLSATRLFSYSRFTIFEGRDKYIVDDAFPIEVFFDLRNDIGRLSLAQYFCELSGALAPQEAEAGEFLRLMLNALYLLGKGMRPNSIVKSSVEMRMLSLAGFMPDLVGCAECGSYESEVMYFLPRSGRIFCADCRRPDEEPQIALSPGALTGLRHTVYAEFGKLFSFSLSDYGMGQLSAASEAYVIETLGRSFQTLDFYHNTESEG
jgi:DNA repair protein RecO (recombination protein O)